MTMANAFPMYIRLLMGNLKCSHLHLVRDALGDITGSYKRLNHKIISDHCDWLNLCGFHARIEYLGACRKSGISHVSIRDHHSNQPYYPVDDLPWMDDMDKLISLTLNGSNTIQSIQVGPSYWETSFLRSEWAKNNTQIEWVIPGNIYSYPLSIKIPYDTHALNLYRQPNGSYRAVYGDESLDVKDYWIGNVCKTVHKAYHAITKTPLTDEVTEWRYPKVLTTLLELLQTDLTLLHQSRTSDNKLIDAYTKATTVTKPTVTVNIKRQTSNANLASTHSEVRYDKTA